MTSCYHAIWHHKVISDKASHFYVFSFWKCNQPDAIATSKDPFWYHIMIPLWCHSLLWHHIFRSSWNQVLWWHHIMMQVLSDNTTSLWYHCDITRSLWWWHQIMLPPWHQRVPRLTHGPCHCVGAPSLGWLWAARTLPAPPGCWHTLASSWGSVSPPVAGW